MLRQWFGKLETGLAVVGMSAVFTMMLLITSEVIMRTLFNRPIAGQAELVGMLMVLVVYSGISYVQRTGGHVGLDLVFNRLRGRVRGSVFVITTVLSLVITLLIAIYSWKQAMITMARGTRSIYLHWPVWHLPLMVSIGSIFLVIRFVFDIWNVKQHIEAHEPEALPSPSLQSMDQSEGLL